MIQFDEHTFQMSWFNHQLEKDGAPTQTYHRNLAFFRGIMGTGMLFPPLPRSTSHQAVLRLQRQREELKLKKDALRHAADEVGLKFAVEETPWTP